MTNSNFSLPGISFGNKEELVKGTATTLQAVEMLLVCFLYSGGEKLFPYLSLNLPEVCEGGKKVVLIVFILMSSL